MPLQAPTPDRQGRIDAAVNAQFAAPIQSLLGDIGALPGQKTAGENAIEFYRTRGKQSITDAYTDALGKLEKNRTAVGQDIDTSGTDIKNLFADATRLSETGRELASQRLAEAAGAENTGAALAVMTPLERAAQAMLDRQMGAQATQEAAYKQWAAQQKAYMTDYGNVVEAQQAGDIASFESGIANALAKNALEYMEKEYDLKKKLNELYTQRGAFAADYGYKLDDQFFNQALQVAQFNLSEAEAASAAASRAASAALAREQFDFEKFKYFNEEMGPNTITQWAQANNIDPDVALSLALNPDNSPQSIAQIESMYGQTGYATPDYITWNNPNVDRFAGSFLNDRLSQIAQNPAGLDFIRNSALKNLVTIDEDQYLPASKIPALTRFLSKKYGSPTAYPPSIG